MKEDLHFRSAKVKMNLDLNLDVLKLILTSELELGKLALLLNIGTEFKLKLHLSLTW